MKPLRLKQGEKTPILTEEGKKPDKIELIRPEIERNLVEKVTKSKDFGDLSPAKSVNFPELQRKSMSLERFPALKDTHRSELPPVQEEKKGGLRKSPSPAVDYVPYTYADYHMQPQASANIGALGAATIGSEDWAKRKDFENRRKAYSRIIFQRNCNQIAISIGRKPFKASPPISARVRALEFARSLPPPSSPSSAQTQQLHAYALSLKAKILSRD